MTIESAPEEVVVAVARSALPEGDSGIGGEPGAAGFEALLLLPAVMFVGGGGAGGEAGSGFEFEFELLIGSPAIIKEFGGK